MYKKIKNIAKSIIPESIIQNNEKLIRGLVSLPYRGSRYECNLCEIKLRKFITLDNGNRLCPNCGSLPRTRRLWDLIKLDLVGKTVLHFSPSNSLKQRITKSNVKKYITTDYEGEFQADEQYDIQAIDLPDETLDIVLCYHILEHIPNDRMAMKELHRVLKDGGVCYIQTPFKDGKIYEDTSIISPEDRLEHFGQEDHLRIYSIEGLKSRLEESGFTVEVFTFADANISYGFEINETVVKATKRC